MVPLLIPGLVGGGALLAANLLDSKEGAAESTTVETPVTVPINGVGKESWVSFVRLMVNPTVRNVTSHHRIGPFEFTVRRLCDLGVMDGARSYFVRGKNPQNTPQVTWNAEWVPPMNLQRFLADTMGQYRLFAESMRRYAGDTRLSSLVGSPIDDTTASLSGLLSVAHRAGPHGFTTWATRPKNRVTFERTTEVYRRANGLF